MKRSFILMTVALVALSLVASGCSSKAKKEKAALQGEIAGLQAQVKQLEDQEKSARSETEKAALKTAEERVHREEFIKALELRLMHNPLEEFKIEPYAGTENGWLIIDGERTFTLFGHPGATKVQFYWVDKGAAGTPQLLGEDSAGKDGWAWRGTLPYGIMKAFWAEIHYSGGLTVKSGVLPIRHGGK